MAQSTNFDVEATLAKLAMPQKIKLLAGLGWWHTEPVPEADVPSMRMSDGPNGVRGTRFFNGVPSNCFPASAGLGSSFDIDLAREIGTALAEECRAKGCHILLGPTVNTQRSPLGGRSFESFSEDPHVNGHIAAAYVNGLQAKGVAATIKHFKFLLVNVANDQEFERFSISSDVTERALREIYLKPFQIAIRESNPWALMTSYNRVNGLHVSENPWLLDEILRKEWGYKGMIMSDWIGTYSTTEAIKAGLDLEMPGPSVVRGTAIARALAGEKLLPGDIDARVRKILELMVHAHESGIPFNGPEEIYDTLEVRALLRRAAADATVLLKNDAGVLPLKTPKSIAVIGPNAKLAFSSGGGSARLLETYTVSALDAISAVAAETGAQVTFSVGAHTHNWLPLLDPYISHDGKPGALVEFWNEEPTAGWLENLKEGPACVWSTPTRGSSCFLMDGIDDSKVNDTCWIRYSTEFTPDDDGDWEFDATISGKGTLFVNGDAVIDLMNAPRGKSFFGLGTEDLRATVKGLNKGQAVQVEMRMSNASFQAGGGAPFSTRGGIRMGGVKTLDPEEAIASAAKAAKEADAVVVIGLNHDLESEGFDRPHMKLPGSTDKLVAEVIKANPNAVIVNQSGSPVDMSAWIEKATTVIQAFYGGNELGNGLADVLFGKVSPSGKLSMTFPKRIEDTPAYPDFGPNGMSPGRILYSEGIYVGYRNYDKKSIDPLFPFGFGLSYTTFEYSDVSATPISADGKFSVLFTVKNIGSVDGREAAQVYISDPVSTLPRPVRELKGFTKVALKAGESKKATVEFDRDALGYYNERLGKWIAEKGAFVVEVAASSRDIRLKTEVELKETFTWLGL